MPGLPTFPAPAPAGPTPTLIPLSTATPAATSTPVIAPTATVTSEPSFTPIPSLTSTAIPDLSATPTATGGLPVPSASVTALTLQPAGTATSAGTATLAAPISLDKLPRDTVYKRVRIDNTTHAQMDISLRCTTRQGLHTILEYSGVKHLEIEAPEGDYVYVVWVGGNQIVGSFSLLHTTSAVITVYPDRVTVR